MSAAKVMTEAYVVAKLGEIAVEAASDPQRATYLERGLHNAVLYAISEGECEDPKACARAALASKDIQFHRFEPPVHPQ